MEAGKIPILLSAGQAVAFLRNNWRFIAAVALAGAGAHLLITVGLAAAPAFASVAITFVSAAVYAALLGAGLYGASNVRARWGRDTVRLWMAMGLVALILAVVSVALVFAAMSILIAPYGEELAAVGEDEARAMAVLQRAVQERPGVSLGLFGACFAAWLALTSRFYLAAPASIDAGRVRVFESWAWTKGNMWRIAAARLAVLGPAAVLWFSLHGMIGAALGLGVSNLFDLSAATSVSVSNPAAFTLQLGLSQAVQIGVPVALEAGLCAYLYRGLKPQQ